ATVADLVSARTSGAHATAADLVETQLAGRPERQARPPRTEGGFRVRALGPTPPGFEHDAEGRLLIGGHDADTLVERSGGTPLFVYDSERIGRQSKRFRAAFPSAVSL